MLDFIHFYYPDSKLTLAQLWHVVVRLATLHCWYYDAGPTFFNRCWCVANVPILDQRSSSYVGRLTLSLYQHWANIKLISVGTNIQYRC